MQVAMRLGSYWWKRLEEKKVYNSTVRECTLWATYLLGIAALSFVGASYLKRIATTPLVNGIYRPGGLAVVALLLMILALMSSMFGIIFSAGAGVVFMRSLFATLRFRTIFSFSPPVTIEGQKAIQLAVDRILAFRAIARQKEYSREEELVEAIEEHGRVIAGSGHKETWINVAASIAQFEHELGELQESKREAERNYYRARDAARSHHLPFPFEVKKSFKDYLPKKVAAA